MFKSLYADMRVLNFRVILYHVQQTTWLYHPKDNQGIVVASIYFDLKLLKGQSIDMYSNDSLIRAPIVRKSR